MTRRRLALAGLRHYRRTHLAVVFGIAAAVAVLAGSFLVGGSVRRSLETLAAARLGRAEVAVATAQPFTEALVERLRAHAGVGGARLAPLFSLDGTARHPGSGRTARVRVYAVDGRFFAFHGVDVTPPDANAVLLSPDLAAELGAGGGDAVIVRVARPTDVPIDSLHGRRDEAGRSMRLTVGGVLGAEAMGEFSLDPSQGPVRAAFVSLGRAQRDLAQAGRVNTLLVAGAAGGAAGVRAALAASIDFDDIGLLTDAVETEQTVLVESRSGLLPDALAASVTSLAARDGLAVTPVLTWLANRIAAGGRQVPYSLVSAIGPDAAGDAPLAALLRSTPGADPPPIVLNEWAARELAVRRGDTVTLEYYRWADEGRLVTGTAGFRLAGVVPMRGLTADRRLAPEYAGITNSRSFADWDPPFPIDLRLVRPADEVYWDRFHTTPKAFIPLEAGQRLWRTRYGQLTSLRLRAPAADADLGAIAARVRHAAGEGIGPLRAGFTIADVGAQAAAAAVGATDFGAYFSYFSFFLMVSALLLAALFFRLSVEQRLAEIGLLRAAGFRLAGVRRLFLVEGGLVAAAGTAAGVGLAVGWAALMMHGLRTWWSGAVGTTRLDLYVDPVALAGGAAAGALAAVGSVALTIGRLSRLSPRQLLTGAADTASLRAPSRWSRAFGIASLGAAALLTVLALAGLVPPAGGFFGAGSLVLAGALALFHAWLVRLAPGGLAEEGRAGVARLGVRNAAWRPGRSLTAAGLVAAAVFLLVSVDSFRKSAGRDTGPRSGTGGFALIGESALPIVHDPSTPEGRDALGLQADDSDPGAAGVRLVALRLREGDDASCLNLYRPQRPRVVGVPAALVEAGRFRFGATLAATDAERANPWRLLGPADAGGVVPAIVDRTSLQYVLHAAVGDRIVIDEATERPVTLRVVAALDDTVLQGEILVADEAFRALYPAEAGFRLVFAEVEGSDPARIDAAARRLEERLAPFGFDAQSAAARLAAFHRVENTYLSTFQTLGGLGVVLGTFGLVAVIARNVLERRRELALLGATGYSGRDLRRLVVAEHLALVAAGLVAGLAAAVVAVGPVLAARRAWPSALPLAWLVLVGATGLLASVGAAARLRRLSLLDALRSG